MHFRITKQERTSMKKSKKPSLAAEIAGDIAREHNTPIVRDPVDDLSIPAFLRRGKEGELPRVKAKRAGAKVAPPQPPQPRQPTLLERLEPEDFRHYVEAEVKSGRIQGKWLADETTIEMLRRQYGGRQEKREEGLAHLAAYKAAHPRPPAKPKQAYPEDVLHITSFDEANPRKPGSANHGKYEGFKKFMAANPSATVLEVVSKSGYYRNDLMHDVKQKRITLGAKPNVKAIVARNIAKIEKEADAKIKKAAKKKK